MRVYNSNMYFEVIILLYEIILCLSKCTKWHTGWAEYRPTIFVFSSVILPSILLSIPVELLPTKESAWGPIKLWIIMMEVFYCALARCHIGASGQGWGWGVCFLWFNRCLLNCGINLIMPLPRGNIDLVVCAAAPFWNLGNLAFFLCVCVSPSGLVIFSPYFFVNCEPDDIWNWIGQRQTFIC